MEPLNGYREIDQKKQKQLLKLVTNSFYRELVKYGFDKSDLINVSVNFLDNVTKSDHKLSENEYYNKVFKISDIKDSWKSEQKISFNSISIMPLKPDDVPIVCDWLQDDSIRNTFITLFPREEEPLRQYYFGQNTRQYFGIYYEDTLVGIIGADRINQVSRNVEMKKLVGASGYQGKGIGKKATFIFLYYIFDLLNYNKVYIHSLDTNIKNINLNSKFGFELEGILYQETILENKFQDVLRMGLLKQTWAEIFKSGY